MITTFNTYRSFIVGKLLLTICVFLFFSEVLQAQKEVYVNKMELEKLRNELLVEEALKQKRVKKFLKTEEGLRARTFLKTHKGMIIDDVVNGKPIFIGADNRGAAITTGASYLKEGGGLGLNLSGEGVKCAIWDTGRVRNTHVEFGNRVINNDPVDIDNHATHVMGTILAAGIDPAAEGMANKAKATAYDFFEDSPEIADEAMGGVMLSNHSYGQRAGWDDGVWRGDTNISTEEDWQFGFYNGRARTWDQIAFNAPSYLIVKSAGNDRGENGTGHPADGPYDCISVYGNAKNILTVGAVGKINAGYSGPASVQMSSFSSWGPTDDGRIKPDLVGAGVGIYSTGSDDDNDYKSQQGTSMSSPNVTGSLILLQELNQNLTGNFMTSASLKGLAIHTIHEAGDDPGPDYRFGWGLLNAKGGAEFLLEKNDTDRLLLEEELANGEEFTIDITPKMGTRVTATLVWTDPAGTPVAASLDPTDLMLVNDLDMRITAGGNPEAFPWILEPSSPADAATTGDNFRDNVEKIEFDVVDEKPYVINISHKNSLTNGSQKFSLLVSYESIAENNITNLYWIGGSGDWSDGNHWSLTSNGTPSGIVPNNTHKVIFDNNSFASSGEVSTVDGDVDCAGLLWLSVDEATLDLAGNNLKSKGNILLNSENLQLKNGNIILENENNENSSNAKLEETSIENVSLVLPSENTGTWALENQIITGLKEIKLMGGALSTKASQFDNIETIQIANDAILEDSLSTYNFNTNGNFIIDNQLIEGSVHADSLALSGNNNYFNDVNVDVYLEVNNTNEIRNLNIKNTSIGITSGTTLEIGETLTIDNTEEISFFAIGSGKATIRFKEHSKFCFDNLNIQNIDATGDGSVSVGVNSTIINSDNWFEKVCDDLLFADFTYEYPCAHALVLMTNTSTGNVENIEWLVEGDSKSTSMNMFNYNFGDAGEYVVTINASDDVDTKGYSKNIKIKETALEANEVILNGANLVSKKFADAYQWYKDGQIIVGATERSYNFNDEEGDYFVLTFDDICNRQSDIYTVGSTATIDVVFNDEIEILPTLFQTQLTIKMSKPKVGHYELVNLQGITVKEGRIGAMDIQSIAVNELPIGMYIMKIRIEGKEGIMKVAKF